MGKTLKELFSSDWAWLPEGLLDSILVKLVTISDYIRFSVVCKPWHSVAKHRRLNIIHKKVPLLMLPPSTPTEEWRALYSVTDNKVYNFKVPLSYNKRICGSSNGWLFTEEENMVLVLINPFSGGTIRLPPIETFAGIEHQKVDVYKIFKASLTADPILYPNDYTIVAIYGYWNDLAYIKSGDKTWTYVDIPKQSLTEGWLSDFVSYKGLIYVVAIGSMVVSVDISGNSSSPTSGVKVVALAPTMHDAQLTYIVESSTGELLLVQRKLIVDKSDHNQRITSHFKIFKLQFRQTGEADRVEVKNLGGDALFLGDNYSMAVLARDFPGCRPNSINFTDDYLLLFHSQFYKHDELGIFNIDDGKSEGFCNLDRPQKFSAVPAIWILPTLRGYSSSA